MGENTKYFSTKMYRVTKHTICGLSLFHSQMLRLLKFRVSHFLARSDSSCAQLLSASSHITGRFAKLLFTKRLKQPLLAVNSNLHPVLAHSLMTIEVRHSPRFSFSRIQATTCFYICTKMSSRNFSSSTSSDTLLAAALYRSLFFKMLFTVDHGRLNFLVMSLVRAPRSLSSMICIFVCRSVKFLDLLLPAGVTPLYVFLLLAMFITLTSLLAFSLVLFSRKHLFIVSLSSLFHSKPHQIQRIWDCHKKNTCLAFARDIRSNLTKCSTVTQNSTCRQELWSTKAIRLT